MDQVDWIGFAKVFFYCGHFVVSQADPVSFSNPLMQPLKISRSLKTEFVHKHTVHNSSNIHVLYFSLVQSLPTGSPTPLNKRQQLAEGLHVLQPLTHLMVSPLMRMKIIKIIIKMAMFWLRHGIGSVCTANTFPRIT